VRGSDFYGRDAFVQIVSDKLRAGHVILAAPRRFGKTSVMFRLQDAPQWNYRIVHADLEKFSEPTELIVHLVEQLARDDKLAKLLKGVKWLPNTLWQFVKNNVEEVEFLEVKIRLKEEIRQHWQERGEELFRLAAKSEETIIFMLDEFPMMIDLMARTKGRRQEAVALLRWLRAIRQSPETEKVRFLIAGSIGIDQVLNGLGEITAIGDFEKLTLTPFPPKVAAAFLDELANTHALKLSPACKRKMLELIGTPVPHFLQILFSEIHKAHAQDSEKITPKRIERLYRERVLGVDCKSYFDHYYGRLRSYYRPDEEKAAKRILRELAVVGAMKQGACWQFYQGIIGHKPDQDRFNQMMTNLENDFYVRFDEQARQYEFARKLLRDWWLRHYGMEAGA
jgi:hypothetical protein